MRCLPIKLKPVEGVDIPKEVKSIAGDRLESVNNEAIYARTIVI